MSLWVLPSPRRGGWVKIFTITKDFTFEAAHQLTGLPDGHQCSRLHGHSYTVRVKLRGLLKEPGWVRDYGDLETFKKLLSSTFDHRNVNQVLEDLDNKRELPRLQISHGARTSMNKNPTAEVLANVFYHLLKRLGFDEVVAVGVSETSKVWAWYEEGI